MWFGAGVFQAWYDYYLLRSKDLTFDVYLEMMSRGTVGFIGGLISGILLSVFLEKWLRKRPYGVIFISTIGIYLILMLCISMPGAYFYFANSLNLEFGDPAITERLMKYISGFGYVKDLVFWGIVIIFTVVAITIRDKYGPGVIWHLITGKYHKPRHENRIIMFLDMKASTTIAEQLGEQKFFNLINDFIGDATDRILWTKGEIYQYIGDEIVVTWKLKNGLQNNNFMRCFFGIKKAINAREDYYMEQYGLVPEFKAGIHEGLCMVGELGVLKREISFYGDLINSTARIQGLCNELGAELLVSDALLNLVQDKSYYQIESLGAKTLKGRVSKVEISRVQMKTESTTT
jgi:adenylate cyclase